MGAFSIWHWLIVLVVVLVLFGGGGKLSKLMGDAGSGIKAFKKGLKEEGQKDTETAAEKAIEDGATDVASNTAEKDKAANG
ncbi:twin-arginine translocase TatA/TatE family subunit [Pelagibius sp. Alg239-R121]|uniref:twin-arginine translocase TatA/TatE family subunit n=1 Tax=Pelagibius sp. Alg239-R121 TaxID=2993448 RepID=UPI0024A7429C|nr:twin-arginine translocase TatA/TatE family subunit [Pelagibius sp. Alg239-R121]